MSEYIITDRQLGLIQDFANVCVEGEKLPRIVRCRDCKHYNTDFGGGCAYFHIGNGYGQEPESMSDGFCAWGERREP